MWADSYHMKSLASLEDTLRRQLAAFAQFTTRSLGERDIDALMLDACLRARAGLNMTHAKLLEPTSAGFDPTVWTGRALQAESAER